MQNKNKIIAINDIQIANHLPLVLIAGPCQMESRETALETASEINAIAKTLNIGFIYKTSFDKANRTSVTGKRGIGLDKALSIFAEIQETMGCPIITDVHTAEQCALVSEVVDILQIPAFLCRQTDLLLAAGKTGKIINIKKGQFLAPWDMKHVASKVSSTGNDNIMLTDRGTCFGYNTLISDMRSLSIMGETGYPIVFDVTHSIQQPGGQGQSSGGERKFIAPLARAAVAVGISTIFIETHPDPDHAPSDGPCMLPLHNLHGLLSQLIELDRVVKNFI